MAVLSSGPEGKGRFNFPLNSDALWLPVSYWTFLYKQQAFF
jgi:hypothetical protein